MQHNRRRRLVLPQAVNLYITYRCRSRCSHCFLVQSGKIDRHELTREALFSIIDQLSELQVFLLIVSGGEPLLHPNFFEVLKYANERRMLPLVAITGTRVSDEEVARYAAAGIPSIQMSLDGASARANDEIRGSGSFSDIVSAVRRFQSAGVSVNLAICVHRQNLEEIEGFFGLCAELKIGRVKLGFYRPFDSDAPVKELHEGEVQRVLALARSFILAHGLPRDWIASPTIDVWTGQGILKRSALPPLTIGADGVLTAGDSGAEIGMLAAGPIAETYSAYVAKKLQQFYEATLQRAFIEFGLSEANEADSLNANALIYRHGDKFIAYVNKGLPPVIKFFSLLHEVGHIATQTMHCAPRVTRHEEEELRANLWALNRLRENLHPEVFSYYEAKASVSEATFFRHIADNLEDDLIGYF